VREHNLGRMRHGITVGRLRRGMLVVLFVGVSCSIVVASSHADGGPSNILPPTIAGATTQGQALTETQGTWMNSPTLTDVWEDCDTTGANCIAITGASNPTYTLTPTDVGHTIVVKETATNGTGGPVSASSMPTNPVAAPPPPPPSNNTPPTITGTTVQGKTLTETQGTWTNSPTLTDAWEDCDPTGANCVAIAGASNLTYTLTPTDVGHTIVSLESASNAGGTGAAVSSSATAVVTVPPPSNISPPTVAGTPTLHQTLAEGHGSWTNSPTSFRYQWEDCDGSGNDCTLIAGATLQTYTLTAADVGHTIVSLESASNAGGTSGSTPSAITAVVAMNGSTTGLSVVPNAPVTNEGVILSATVTSVAPQGTITFDDHGVAISGCAGFAVDSQSTIVTCQTSFSAASSPEQLTAVFAPTAPSSVAASISSTELLLVAQGSTSTAVGVPSRPVRAGAAGTYTATVTPGEGGVAQPSGSVTFLDGGEAIAACAKQPLTARTSSLTATCKLTYAKTGAHHISASYSGDANFRGSTSSPPQTLSIVADPVHVAGTITSAMQWSFHYTPAYTNVLSLVVKSPPIGATVLLECHGRGCPFAKQAKAVTKHEPINLMRSFRKQRLRAGTQITVELTQPGWIGEDYRFTTRARRGPRIQVACLAPGETRPGAGC